ncbi:hypothetical protein AB835_13220 [Candidatus Endobugula sertula]|uniref:Knr4/Smi1-like domain-containing protein n=1 Tax=Candidatus Endobugula sertula TaxID=62101 RepID=A0A1D2QM19_9GAMM|nr:hypothetical protein AB835_13220 [Candidatus Endobugula sertula]
MSKIKFHRKLDEILSFVEAGNNNFAKHLNKGVDENYIKEQLLDINISPNSEILWLYSWKNGMLVEKGTPLDDIQFFPGYHFLSIDDAILQYSLIKGDDRWNSSWLPFMANGAGDYYMVDLSALETVKAPVLSFFSEESECDIEYECIDKMTSTFLEGFRKKIIYYDQYGYLEMDDDKYCLLAGNINPTIDFWKYD